MKKTYILKLIKKMEKYARRGYVITCTALRHKPIEIHSDLIKVYGDSGYSLIAVKKLFAYHRNGDEKYRRCSRFWKINHRFYFD